MRLKPVQYIYVLLSCVAGAWQGWCFGYASRTLMLIPMGLPFALVSYAHASLVGTADDTAERPNWKGILVLWAGMPLSLAVGALTILAETGIMYVSGFGIVDLPFDNLRLLIGEGAACLVWAMCLLIWSRQRGIRLSRNRLLALFAALFAGVLTAHALSKFILRGFQGDHYFPMVSIVTTTISALILVRLRRG